jgi:hypothetical protein
MTSRSIGWIVGLALGCVFALVGLVVVPEVSDQMLLGAYAIILIFVSAALASSARAGLVLAVFTILSETLIEMAYFVSVYGAHISLVPYAVGFILFVGRILLFPLAGAFGGYLGQEYFGETSKRRTGEKDQRRPRGRTAV